MLGKIKNNKNNGQKQNSKESIVMKSASFYVRWSFYCLITSLIYKFFSLNIILTILCIKSVQTKKLFNYNIFLFVMMAG